MSRVLYELKSGRAMLESISIMIPTNGTSDPVVANINTTQECTVKYGATGKYTVTFTRPYSKNFGVAVDYNKQTANGDYAQIDSVNLNSSGVAVVVIGIYTNAGVASAPAAANAASNVVLSITVGL